ncbi:MAG TPA: hypothetical protein VFQ82_04055 [Stellaceae bacterium]|nr:hypothetical protein [Stellaceae bacterium]
MLGELIETRAAFSRDGAKPRMHRQDHCVAKIAALQRVTDQPEPAQQACRVLLRSVGGGEQGLYFDFRPRAIAAAGPFDQWARAEKEAVRAAIKPVIAAPMAGKLEHACLLELLRISFSISECGAFVNMIIVNRSTIHGR